MIEDTRIVLDSENKAGIRCTSFVCIFPRIVLSEFNTHRALSKNSASSRAIPFKKMAKMVEDNPFIPLKWMKDHKGMQGTEYFPEKSFAADGLKYRWLKARDAAVAEARAMNEAGLTKQICNRLLEPFMWHTVIVTGTEWENFFALRAHPDAEIHIQHLAYTMLNLYNNSKPQKLETGDWHMPFGDKLDGARLYNTVYDLGLDPNDHYDMQQARLKVATARCARVSYLNFEGKDDYEADMKLHDALLESGHFSPFEHCACAVRTLETGNFRGWIQYRKTLRGECRTDERVVKSLLVP